MDDLEERALKAGIQIAVRTNFINKPANAVANLKVCEFVELTFTVETGSNYYFAPVMGAEYSVIIDTPARSMQSRVYVTIGCPSTCLSLSSAEARSSVRRVCCCGSAGRRYRSIASRPEPQQHRAAARRSAANVGSATFSADV